MQLLFACLCCLLALWPADASAAAPLADTLHLGPKPEGPWRRYFAYSFDAHAQPGSGARGLALWEAGRFRGMGRTKGVFQAAFTQDRLWVRATVVNTLPQRTRFVWNVYSFVDSAVLFRQAEPGRGALRRLGGTSGREVAAARAFPTRAITVPFWLEAGERAVLFLRLDNHSGTYYTPLRIAPAESYLQLEYKRLSQSPWPYMLGLYVGSALVALLFYAFLRDRIFLWYAGYVALATMFLLMEDGLDADLLPQSIYGLGWRLGQYGVLLLAQAAGLRILAAWLRLRAGWPRLHRLSVALSGLGAAYALVYALAFDLARQAGPQVLLALHLGREVLLWLLLLGGAGLLAVVWWRGRPAQRRLARLYALTYVWFFGGAVNFLLNHTGKFNIHLVQPNALAWGLTLELLVLGVLLTGRFRAAQRQATDLRLRRLQEREGASRRLIEAQDAEREALAQELHDALAPGLTALHLAWQGRLVKQALAEAPPLLAEAHQRTENLLRQLRHDVRALSQVLLPATPGHEQPPLPVALALLTETLGLADGGVRVALYCDEAAAELPAPVQQAAYRIVAELLHNTLRHAQARHVRVEVRRLPASLRLMVEDDGRGFDPAAPLPARGGLGLRGVQARAGYLRGQVLVSAQPGRGTHVTVELPVSSS